MIFDHKFEDFQIEYPLKDYGTWLIAEIRNKPPHIAEYVLRGNRIYIVSDVQDLPNISDDYQVFKVKFDWCNNMFIDIDGKSLEVVKTPDNRTFKQATLNYHKWETGAFDMEIGGGDIPITAYGNLLKQAFYGLTLEEEDITEYYFVFSTGENFHFVKQTINGAEV